MKPDSARTGETAFFNPRVLVGILFCFVGVTLALFAFDDAVAHNKSQSPVISGIYRGLAPIGKFDVSLPLRDMQVIPLGPGKLRENEDRDIVPLRFRFVSEVDPVVQTTVNGTQIPAPVTSFDGPSNSSGVVPPDPNGAVGPNHVVVMSNLSFQIYDKTGTSLFGPAANNTLWSGFGGPCETENAGSPIVLHDQLADRWLLAQSMSLKCYPCHEIMPLACWSLRLAAANFSPTFFLISSTFAGFSFTTNTSIPKTSRVRPGSQTSARARGEGMLL